MSSPLTGSWTSRTFHRFDIHLLNKNNKPPGFVGTPNGSQSSKNPRGVESPQQPGGIPRSFSEHTLSVAKRDSSWPARVLCVLYFFFLFFVRSRAGRR
jgi:hypothetical protein